MSRPQPVVQTLAFNPEKQQGIENVIRNQTTFTTYNIVTYCGYIALLNSGAGPNIGPHSCCHHVRKMDLCL